MTYSLKHVDDGYGCAMLLGCGVAVGYDFGGDKRTHTVVYPDEGALTVDQCQSVGNGMEACRSAVGEGVRDVKCVFVAEVLPIVLHVFWEYQNDVHGWVERVETLNRVHEDRLAFYGQELFGNVCPHAQTFAACNNYYSAHICV